MVISPGQSLTLTIEKPAAGGRMIARASGQIVLVAGTIPGERVNARVERIAKGVVYADTVTVEEPSSDRREPFTDPRCGGCLYSHIAYARQLEIKAQVVADAFGRIGHLTLPGPLHVVPSPPEGYRMRARMHVRADRVGLFREGTHDLCDARVTRQLLPETCDVLDRLAAGLRSLGIEAVRELELSENLDASERVVHLDLSSPADPQRFAPLGGTEGLSGITVGSLQSASGSPLPAGSDPQSATGARVVAGDPHVTDRLLIQGREVSWRRHVLGFFQGNRYLLPALVANVAEQIEHGSGVIDLYAGAGLFSVPAAVVCGARVTAVEGDRVAAADLASNARQADGAVRMVHQSVEAFTAGSSERPDVLIVDPPRTGMSKDALTGAIRLGAKQVIYVSCDVATLARDARRLVDAGYGIAAAAAFDMFPNTPHVEMTVRFERNPRI